MEKQRSFASAAWNRKGKVTRRELFLAEMDAVIAWRRLLELISPRYHQRSRAPRLVIDQTLRRPRQSLMQGEARTFGSNSLPARCLLRTACAELP